MSTLPDRFADVEALEEFMTAPSPELVRDLAALPGDLMVLGAGGTLEERGVETGVSNWEFTEVTAGLALGDKVVTSLERAGVRAGARAVAEAKPAAPRQ